MRFFFWFLVFTFVWRVLGGSRKRQMAEEEYRMAMEDMHARRIYEQEMAKREIMRSRDQF